MKFFVPMASAGIEPHECVVCLDSYPPPIQSGCACRSDTGLAHVGCLIEKAVAQQPHRGNAVWWKCQTCGLYPCECPCEKCGEFPCKCIGCVPPDERHAPGFEVLEVMASGGGGSVGADDVAERSIEVARMLSDRYNSHRHANPVQLAHAIEKAYPIMGGVNERVGESATPLERLNTSKRRVLSLIGKIAAKSYGGDFERAWVECLMKPYGTDWKTAGITWSIEQIEKFSLSLETIITKGK